MLSARRGRSRRRGRGSAPAASPTRLTRRPAGGAQDEGVPLRQSAPPPPPPPAPIVRAALVNNAGLSALFARRRPHRRGEVGGGTRPRLLAHAPIVPREDEGGPQQGTRVDAL